MENLIVTSLLDLDYADSTFIDIHKMPLNRMPSVFKCA